MSKILTYGNLNQLQPGQIQLPNIVLDSLVFYIDPSNTSSYSLSNPNIIYDISGRNRFGTLPSGITYQSNNSGILDISSGRINIQPSLNSYSSNNPHTYSAWINISNIFGNVYYFVLGNGTLETGDNLILQRWGPTGTQHLVLSMLSSGGNVLTNLTTFTNQFTNPLLMPKNIWYNISVVYQNNTYFFYTNGVLLGSRFVSSFDSGNLNPNIGQWFNGAFQYFGKIGSLMVYSKALSQSEILQNYNAELNRFL
jgi:hypothetical protein